jgi:hypothetical protein
MDLIVLEPVDFSDFSSLHHDITGPEMQKRMEHAPSEAA